MPSMSFLVAMVIIIVSMAFILYWVFTNYNSISGSFFTFLGDIPLFATGG